MIRIQRRGKAPEILTRRGQKETKALCDEYKRDKLGYDCGEKKFEFDSSIYAAKSVKNALIRSQHGKCGFCESKVTYVTYGDVEHFRPKAGFVQSELDSLERPGYYWLAYSWSNLIFCCPLCNQRFKRNLFPLENPEERARCHEDDIEREKPLLIHPAVDDPAEFLGFRQEIPYAKPGSKRGSATIQALGLARPELNEVRLDYYKQLLLLKKNRDLLLQKKKNEEEISIELEEMLTEIEDQLHQSQQDDAPFAAMARALMETLE